MWRGLLLLLTLLVYDGLAWTYTSTSVSLQEQADRRSLLVGMIAQPMVVGFVTLPNPVYASNLPASTGADTSKVGTIETLKPIVSLRKSLDTLSLELNKRPPSTALRLDAKLPMTEKDFKRLFDEYSDPVSYKQKFLDQNAFLVYYTKGFDGPGRGNIEEDINERQTQQFGLRNEAWIAWESFLAELKFLDDADNDCQTYLSATNRAIDAYLDLVPAADLKAAKKDVESGF